MLTNMEHVSDVFKYPVDVKYSDIEPLQDEEMDKLKGLIEINHITFGYNKLEAPVIEDFSMRGE